MNRAPAALAAGLAAAGLFSGAARADETPSAGRSAAVPTPAPSSDSVSMLPPLEVTGTATSLPHDVPQSVDTFDQTEVSEQGGVTLAEVLRNVPGITLNAGEGGSHGDSLNLRGISVPDSFFVDGVRDIGLYQRDTFDEEAAEVLLGPSSVLFGRGSTAGVINQVTKQASLVPEQVLSFEAGTAGMERATADLDWAFGNTTAARLNLMDERTGIAERNDVETHRGGIAPTVAFGVNTPTQVTLSYLHQVENDLPDYGIPFIGGTPAHVNRGNFYGLINYDRTKTNADIGTVRLEHTFNDQVSLTESFRYARYGYEYLLSAPHLDDDFTELPPAGTPLSDIVIYRDQPSSAGTENELVDHVDLTTKFETAGFAHTLISGIELSRENSDVTKYVNGIDDLPPTPLLDPSPYFSPATPLTPVTQPHSNGTDVSFSLMDRIRLSKQWDFDAGARWDRFNSYFSEAATDSAFSRNDTEVSPRGALVFKPDARDSFYASYGASYNPAIEYLTLAPSSRSLAPEKDHTAEVGTRIDVAGGLTLTGAAFDTLLSNARQADPDDPTVQFLPFDQRVLGVEFGASGHLTPSLEVHAGYTHLDDRITASTDPDALRKEPPNIPTDSANLWVSWEPGRAWRIAGGPVAMSERFADTHNTASVPAFVVVNGMIGYRVNAHFDVQLNVNNIANTLYYSSVYYTEVDENHAVPGPGRTFLLTGTVRF